MSQSENTGTVSHTTTLRVRYADTDKMKIVYNGVYLVYFEVGRTEMLRACGIPGNIPGYVNGMQNWMQIP